MPLCARAASDLRAVSKSGTTQRHTTVVGRACGAQPPAAVVPPPAAPAARAAASPEPPPASAGAAGIAVPPERWRRPAAAVEVAAARRRVRDGDSRAASLCRTSDHRTVRRLGSREAHARSAAAGDERTRLDGAVRLEQRGDMGAGR